MSETTIKNAIMKKLRLGRGFFYRAGASTYSKSGISDIMGTYFGFAVAIEVKTPVAWKTKNNGRTSNQIKFHSQVENAGGFVATVCSVRQTEEFLGSIEESIVLQYGESFLEGLR